MMGSSLALVWAQGRSRELGLQGALPWYLPEDLHHFKALTSGGSVIMGRHTWESLPGPLPDRQNIIVTSAKLVLPADAIQVASATEAVQAATQDRVFGIGGVGIYQALAPMADQIHITEILASFDADVYAPALDSGWQFLSASSWHRSTSGFDYRFTTYTTGDNDG